MDKAKAYDEALEKAKGLLDSPRTCFDINQLKDIFPQLKESDDERVRKDIIDHFESIKSQALYDNQEGSDNIISSCNEKIAYLEKQKEETENATKTLAKILEDSAEGFRRILKKKGIDYEVSDKFWENEAGVYSKEENVKFHKWMDDLMGPTPVEETNAYKKGLEAGMKQKEQKVDIDKLRRDLYQSGYNDGYQHGKEDAQKEQESIPNTYGCLNCTKWEECEKGLTPCSGHRLKIVDQKPTDDKAFEEWIDSWFKEHKEKAYPQITMDEKEFKNFCRGIRNMYQQKSDWSEEDERMFSRCIKSIECSKKFADSETYKAAKDVEINWLKDIYLNYKKFTEAVEKLWSNDWSEEDEEALDMCLDAIPKRWKTKSGILLTKWLKDNIHLQPKQDWNEEDEEIWFALITFFKTYLQKYPPACKDEKIQANRILKWLNTTIKSFRLHHRYKPNEEQIKAIKNALDFYAESTDTHKHLKSLLNELVKL